MARPLESPRGRLLEVVVLTYGTTTSICLSGEADLGSLQSLSESLASVDLSSTVLVHLDVTGLEFCDVATVHELAGFAHSARSQHLMVVTAGASPVLEKLARLLGVDADLGIGDPWLL